MTPPSSLASAVISGTVAVSNFPASQAVTGPLTDAQLRASAVPISAASLPLPSGAATSAAQTDGSQRVGGTVLVDASAHPQPVTGPLTDTQLRATPVPVSGTVSTGGLTDTQLRASAVPISAAALPLPSGAATSAAQTDGSQRVGGTVTVDGSGHTQPVSGTVAVSGVAGTVTVDGSAVTQPVSADSLPLPDGAATEDTLARVNGAVQDVALTAILEREKIPA